MSDSRSKDKLAHREAVVGVIDTLAERYLRGKIQAIRLAMIGLLSLPVMGAVAPIGGTLMIGGWIVLAVAAFRSHIVNA